MENITIYSRNNCHKCVEAKALLDSKGADYVEINIEDRPEEEANLQKRGGDTGNLPQIFIGDHHIKGWDELYTLDKGGKLGDILRGEEEKVEHHRVAIIGSGPAGYTAGIYTGRANLSPILFTGNEKGGQLTSTTDIENFPGFPQGVDGVELMMSMEKQAERFGTSVVYGEIGRVDLNTKPITIYRGEGKVTADTLIIATGAKARYLEVPGEEEYRGRGVSACATCDGFFFRGQEAAIVGGGDTAMEEASYLANICSKVYLIHRRDTFRASQAMQDRVKDNPKIEILYNTTVEEVMGDGNELKKLKLKSTVDGSEDYLDVNALFVAIGHTPNTGFLEGQLPLDEKGYLLVNGATSETTIPGVFACGDVTDSNYRQAITAAGSGCKAAIDAERWLKDMAD